MVEVGVSLMEEEVVVVVLLVVVVVVLCGQAPLYRGYADAV